MIGSSQVEFVDYDDITEDSIYADDLQLMTDKDVNSCAWVTSAYIRFFLTEPAHVSDVNLLRGGNLTSSGQQILFLSDGTFQVC